MRRKRAVTPTGPSAGKSTRAAFVIDSMNSLEPSSTPRRAKSRIPKNLQEDTSKSEVGVLWCSSSYNPAAETIYCPCEADPGTPYSLRGGNVEWWDSQSVARGSLCETVAWLVRYEDYSGRADGDSFPYVTITAHGVIDGVVQQGIIFREGKLGLKH